MAACTAWSFRGFSCCLKCSELCNWYFQRWNCESSDRRTKESNLFCFIGPRYICLPSNCGTSLNYQVAPAKTGLISHGENHSLSWQFLHMRDRKRGRSRQRSLLLRFPAQIETSASREPTNFPPWDYCVNQAHNSFDVQHSRIVSLIYTVQLKKQVACDSFRQKLCSVNRS
jgi:hypothetical protein